MNEDAAAQRRLRRAGVVLAVFGAIALSGKAIVIELAYRHGVDATTLLALRMLVVLPFFLLMRYATRRDGKQQLTGSGFQAS